VNLSEPLENRDLHRTTGSGGVSSIQKRLHAPLRDAAASARNRPNYSRWSSRRCGVSRGGGTTLAASSRIGGAQAGCLADAGQYLALQSEETRASASLLLRTGAKGTS